MHKSLFISILMAILLTSFVVAIPGAPHQFWGTATNNGNAVPNNLLITAEIDGVWIHARGAFVQAEWEKYREFYKWQLENDIYPVSAVGGIRGSNEFSGLFLKEDAEKVMKKLKELGIE